MGEKPFIHVEKGYVSLHINCYGGQRDLSEALRVSHQ